MATYNRTVTGGGTIGHPSNLAKAYVVTSPVWDTADGGAGGDRWMSRSLRGEGQWSDYYGYWLYRR